ncbi:hypothetical protein F5Y00DRAFT_249303 [Daldinia vernicosa]|uniref:uncharacterized protein n=1 Tax=Daldinia vernicosa TaxID=114800 RepID=UPI00200870FB|nr:uncharacterized protein F5Y00DRAFT_249303 [Daldinia vernicosa]KAI0844153.1 hypothetical protein F5Y00DRAFT_249303 [Daldinia vernicosa]
MAESMDEDVGGLAGPSSNKVVKKARVKPRSKPTTRQSTGSTKNVARRLFETASSPDDDIEHQPGQLVGIDKLLSRLEGLTKVITDSISATQATQSIPGTSSVSQLRREDIGRFNPDYPDPKNVGMIFDGNTPIFTDLDRFVERVESFLEDHVTAAANEKQLKLLFEILLDGPAALWWSYELTYDDRRSLRRAGLAQMLAALKRRFHYSYSWMTLRNPTGLTIEEIAEDENRLMQFFQTKLRDAKLCGRLDKDHKNWPQVFKGSWKKMGYDIHDVLPAPSDEFSLEEYMKEVQEAKPRLFDTARMYHLIDKSAPLRGYRDTSSDESED